MISYLALPNDQYSHAHLPKLQGGPGITTSVRAELLCPESRIGLWNRRPLATGSRCQKQPLRKMAHRLLRLLKSGEPGSDPTLRR